MINIQSEGRRGFLRAAAAFAVLPLLPGCRPDVSAQIGGADVRQRLLKNAIADAGCEWCGARDMPENLASKAVIAGPDEEGERLRIGGRVYLHDERTPAPNTLIYLYHTDIEGIYGRGSEHKHGRFRGWLLTDAEGRYEFETIRPAQYPSRRFAAHIHMTVTTPEAKEDWIDSILFEGDQLISSRERESRKGGFNPILTLERSGGVLTGVRDIALPRS
ncbi:MAG: intradiol ring-cleavage dioxygenase [Acidobacteria bacterium]|nr:intradiol ring-cleavage dioxygenase [Acidobacteriota bacterium]